MQKTLILLLLTMVVVSCGNKKTNQVSDNSTEKSNPRLLCTTKKTIGSNMPTRNCQTLAEREEERKKQKQQIREIKTIN